MWRASNEKTYDENLSVRLYAGDMDLIRTLMKREKLDDAIDRRKADRITLRDFVKKILDDQFRA